MRALLLRSPLGAALRRPGVERVVATVNRSAVVRRRARFVLAELAPGRRRVLAHALRDGSGTAVIRHGTGDVVTLDEVFLRRDYDPPPAVRARLGRPARVLDLGANVGLFLLHAAAAHPGAALVGFEPDPANAAVLRRALARSGVRAEVHEAAAGTAPGTLRFLAGRVALSRAARPGESGAIAVPVVDVLPLMAAADLVKLDVEGGEWPLLADPRFAAAPPRALVLEYHPEGRADPAGEIRGLLTAAGLAVEPIWERDDGHGMLWAWRP